MIVKWIAPAALLVVGTLVAALALQTGAQEGVMMNTVTTAQSAVSTLPDYGPAPELTNAIWLNTPDNQPLPLADLRGKVVLLEFWTFDCINCIHTIPYVEAWHQQYAADGLVVIGDHFPEFGFERDLNNLKDAITRLGITYAVAQDNDGVTWNAYNQMYWPTIYLIDRQGHLRYRQIGEGGYKETEAAIQTLLAEPYAAATAAPDA